MGILERVLAGLSVLAVGFAVAGCSGVDVGDGEVTNGSVSASLTVPYSATDVGAGTVKYSVTLPSGQHFVEVFARKNGVQNTAHDITASGLANGDGTTTYSYAKTGYQAGDKIDYRFYSYVGPAVFTPGPTQTVWVSFTYGGATTFKTSAGNYLLANQKDASGRTFSYQVETSVGTTFVTPYSTGWFMTKASPTGTEIAVEFVEADLAGTFVKKAGSDVYDPVSAYDTYTIGTFHGPDYLDITVEDDTAEYPGQRIDSAHAEGGRSITIPTFIGPQTLTTDAKVTFAYLIKQKSWSGQ